MWKILLIALLLSLSMPAWAQSYHVSTETGILPWPTVPNMGTQTKNGTVFYDTSYTQGAAPPVGRCTDQPMMASTHPNFSKDVGMGGSGDALQLFEVNARGLHFLDTGGFGYLTLFNPVTGVCGDPITGKAITADKNLSNPGSATTVYSFGSSGSWDWVTPGLWYSFASGADATGLTVVPYTINTATGTFTVGSAIADFQYGLPLGNLVQAWALNTAYAQGAYVSYTLSSTEAPTWVGSNAYSTLGTIIKPTNAAKNPLGCAFKLTVAGTSAASGLEPPWSTTGTCVPASNGQLTDGTAKWRNLGNGGTFVFQLTSSSCTSGGSTPAFVPAGTGRPDLMTTVTDGGTCVWTNVGPEVAPAWQSFAGVSRNGNRFCSAFSTDSYGWNNDYVNTNGGQGEGIYLSCSDAALKEFILYNTATGIQSKIDCSSGSVASCASGTMSAQVATTIFTGNCGVFIHNLKQSTTNDYPVLTRQGTAGNVPLTTGCATPPANNLYDWQPFHTPNASTTMQLYNSVSNHWAEGFSHLVNIGSQITGPPNDFTNGIYDKILDSTNPSAAGLVSWQPTCDASWVLGSTLPPCNFTINDSHLSLANNPNDADTAPVCGTFFNDGSQVGTAGYPIIMAPWQGEEICVATTPTFTNPGTAPKGTVWRFTHTFSTETSSDFSDQFSISQLSQVTSTGQQFLAFGSNWNCTLGDTAGNATNLCGLPWQSNFAYTLNTLLHPVSTLGGSGAAIDVFKVTNIGSGTSGTSWPACPSCTPANSGFATAVLAFQSCTGQPANSCNIADNNSVVYTVQGPSTDKGEVFIVKLTPAIPVNLAEGARTVTLNWNASSGALTYNVYRGTSNGGPYVLLANVATTSYTETVAPSQTLYYVVTAVNANGESVNSNQATAPIPLFDTLSGSESDATSVQIGETLSTVDALVPAAALIAPLAETLSTSDLLAAGRTHVLSLGETLSTSDSLVPTAALKRALTENLSINDSLGDNFHKTAGMGESLTTVDALSRSFLAMTGLAETLSTSDAIAATATIRSTGLAENLPTSDNFYPTGTLLYGFGETLTTVDALTLTVTLPGGSSNGTAIYSLGNYGIAPVRACAFTLQIFGQGFTSQSVVTWNGAVRAVTYISPRQLQITLLNGDLAATGTVPVIVWLGSYATAARYFSVVSSTPTIEGAQIAGGALVVDGKNFVPGYGVFPGIVSAGSTLFWNGQPLITSWISPTRLQAIMPPKTFAIGNAVITVADTGCFQ